MGYRNIEWYSDMRVVRAMGWVLREGRRRRGKVKVEWGIIGGRLKNEDWKGG